MSKGITEAPVLPGCEKQTKQNREPSEVRREASLDFVQIKARCS